MSRAQPIHRLTGERGPVCESATEAVLWIVTHEDPGAWTWECVAVPAAEESP